MRTKSALGIQGILVKGIMEIGDVVNSKAKGLAREQIVTGHDVIGREEALVTGFWTDLMEGIRVFSADKGSATATVRKG